MKRACDFLHNQGRMSSFIKPVQVWLQNIGTIARDSTNWNTKKSMKLGQILCSRHLLSDVGYPMYYHM